MSDKNEEDLRVDIWDLIYRDGPQSIEQLSEQLQMGPPTVAGLVDHAWFFTLENKVHIAVEEQP